MNAHQIDTQTFLELKPERQEAYGLPNPYVYVDKIATRGHYKTPWIYARPCPSDVNEMGAFRPSDFKRAVGPREAGHYRETLEKAEGVVRIAPELEQVTEGIWTVEQARRFALADLLKDWVRDELTPDLGASFAADLLGSALDNIDWDEIASSWLEQVAEQD